MVGTIAVEVARHDQNALGASGDQLFDGRNLTVIVAIELAGEGLCRDAKFFGLGLKTLLHLYKEGVGVGLGDEPN